ncbi:hypothetical protein [Arsenophonus endosymbiont of Bemisia tabaci]|nr:hypothetical protein [Arsenophonus endosymbiont of Bemisia tabaci]
MQKKSARMRHRYFLRTQYGESKLSRLAIISRVLNRLLGHWLAGVT